MQHEQSLAQAGDRRDDRPMVVRGVAKPPVLSRRTLCGLCALCLVAVVYGTLGPLGVRGGQWIASAATWRWVPAWQSSDWNDLITNFMVYVPVGIAFRLLVRRRGQAGWVDLALGLVLSAALSYLTEVLQQFMPARSSSLTDVLVNSAGALVGCVCAVWVQDAFRHLHALFFVLVRASWSLWIPFVVLAGLLIVWQWTALFPRQTPTGSAAQWVPFHAHFSGPFPAAVAAVIGRLAGYGMVTLILLFVTRGGGGAAALLLLLGGVAAAPAGRGVLVGGPADATSVLLAVCAWLAAMRLWRSLFPPLRGDVRVSP